MCWLSAKSCQSTYSPRRSRRPARTATRNPATPSSTCLFHVIACHRRLLRHRSRSGNRGRSARHRRCINTQSGRRVSVHLIALLTACGAVDLHGWLNATSICGTSEYGLVHLIVLYEDSRRNLCAKGQRLLGNGKGCAARAVGLYRSLYGVPGGRWRVKVNHGVAVRLVDPVALIKHNS
jgi:hypothetical protein